MKKQYGWLMVLGTVAVLALGSAGLRAADPVSTKISVPGIHCDGCAKKLATALAAVKGVATIKTDVEAKTVIVTPKPQTALSPKALWEAVEKAKKEPKKLEGPSGTFTERPKF